MNAILFDFNIQWMYIKQLRKHGFGKQPHKYPLLVFVIVFGQLLELYSHERGLIY